MSHFFPYQNFSFQTSVIFMFFQQYSFLQFSPNYNQFLTKQSQTNSKHHLSTFSQNHSKIHQPSIRSDKKMNKLLTLKEISPKQLDSESIFSNDIEKSNRIILSQKGTRKMKNHIETGQFEDSIRKQNLKPSNRKQTEKLNIVSDECKVKNLPTNSEGQSFSNLSIHCKSFTSTNANTERSQKEVFSNDSFSDQKSIINPCLQKIDENPEKNSTNQLTIEDFDILNFCGQGAFGSVYIAKHKATGSIYALKKIVKATVSDDLDKQSLIRQIKIHLKLNHPNIIKFYGTFSTAKAIYFILELCHSGNLYEQLLKQGTFSEQKVQSIIRQVCSALEYLHNKNIIHRDIKAQNIIIHENVAKICDFGWASQGQYSRKSLCGTPAYISPEIIQNKLYDRKVDVWSMGILTFELIYGRIPFDIRTQEDLHKIVFDELLFPSERQISFACQDFIMKCLQKDSCKRWDTTRLLKHPFLKKE